MPTSHWNYRVIREVNFEDEDTIEYDYSIREVYYESKDDTIPIGWSEKPDGMISDEPDFSWLISKIQEAQSKPVLEIKDDKLVEVV